MSADKLFVFAKCHTEGIISNVVPGYAVLLNIIVLIIAPVGFLPVTIGKITCAEEFLIKAGCFTCYRRSDATDINALNNLTVTTEPCVNLYIVVGINCYVFVARVLKNCGDTGRLPVDCSSHHMALAICIVVKYSVALISKTDVYRV